MRGNKREELRQMKKNEKGKLSYRFAEQKNHWANSAEISTAWSIRSVKDFGTF